MLLQVEYGCCMRLSMDAAGVGHGMLLPDLVLGGSQSFVGSLV